MSQASVNHAGTAVVTGAGSGIGRANIADADAVETLAVHAFVPRMLRQAQPAHIVNTASALGLMPGIELGPYCATKHAVVGMSQSLDLELRGRGIGVTALCPGVIDTAVVRESTMRGSAAQRQGRAVEVHVVPASQVYPMWVAGRISTKLGGVAARFAHRLIWGRE